MVSPNSPDLGRIDAYEALRAGHAAIAHAPIPARRARHETPRTALFARTLARTLAGVLARMESFAYSSGLAAVVGFALTLAAGTALASPETLRGAALVGAATYCIYGIDRLRDLECDHATAPRRSHFVARHRGPLAIAAASAGLAALLLLAGAPRLVALVCLPIGTVGLAHRRLKSNPPAKIAYVAGAWCAACVGIPFATGSSASAGDLAFALGTLGAALLANVVASNLRVGKHELFGFPRAQALAFARALALVGVALGALAPATIAALAAIPAAELLALAFFRSDERYAHLAIDGALALGALVAWGALAGPAFFGFTLGGGLAG